MNVTIAQSPRGATGEDIVMSRTRRAVAAIAVVATLGTGTVTACTGPPPTEEAWTSLWNSIGVVLWINIANERLHEVLKRIDLTPGTFGNPYTSSYAGLQSLPQAMQLGRVDVPAGSLLLFDGNYYYTQPSVVAVDPASGSVHDSGGEDYLSGYFAIACGCGFYRNWRSGAAAAVQC